LTVTTEQSTSPSVSSAGLPIKAGQAGAAQRAHDDQVDGRGEHDRCVPGVRDSAQDRVQDLNPYKDHGLAGDVRVPAKSTIHAVLDRHGLVSRMGRKRNCVDVAPLLRSRSPSAACRRRSVPTTTSSSAAPSALLNLPKLAVSWLRLGIEIERIKPGKPQQNGRHEGMRRRLKQEATRPPGMNSLQQQDRFKAFREEFNTERPHEPQKLKLRDAGMTRIMTDRRCAGVVSSVARGGRACPPAAKKA
jgi:hypothetical protein